MTVDSPPKNKKLYFALLNNGWLRREFAAKQLPAMRNTEGVELVWENPENTWHHPIYSNRNAIVQRFLKTDCDFLMMQDDDIVPLHNPAELVWADKDIIGSPAKVRQNGQQINWVAFLEDKERGGYFACDFAVAPCDADLVEVDIVGTGLILIKRHVLEAIKSPFTVENDENGICTLGTDFAFCKRARALGYKVHTSIHRVCEHYKEGGLLESSGYDDSDYFCHDNTKYELTWGEWAILQKDWRYIQEIFRDQGIRRVAEFGAGLSSLLMSERVPVTSYETNPKWAWDIKSKAKEGNHLEVKLWDGITPPKIEDVDLVFIDGPPGGVPPGRRFSYMAAADSGAKYILTHDSGREGELGWAKEFLWPKYRRIGTNGIHQQRLELWERKSDAAGKPGKDE